MTDLTEEEVQAQLAGQAVRGPRQFRGRTLAPYSRGLRDLHHKILRPGDSDSFYEVSLLQLLSEAQSVDESKRLETRARLLLETDNAPLFRGRLSLLLDELSEADLAAAARTVNEILEEVEQSKVAIAPDPKKNALPAAAAAPSLTTTPSSSSNSAEFSPAPHPDMCVGS